METNNTAEVIYPITIGDLQKVQKSHHFSQNLTSPNFQ